VLVFVREKARKYAIVKELDELVSLKDGTVVLQFETQLQDAAGTFGVWTRQTLMARALLIYIYH